MRVPWEWLHGKVANCVWPHSASGVAPEQSRPIVLQTEGRLEGGQGSSLSLLFFRSASSFESLSIPEPVSVCGDETSCCWVPGHSWIDSQSMHATCRNAGRYGYEKAVHYADAVDWLSRWNTSHWWLGCTKGQSSLAGDEAGKILADFEFKNSG